MQFIYSIFSRNCVKCIAFIVSLLTFLLFYKSVYNDFVDLDDLGYIVDNRNIDSFNWDTVVWAFTNYHEANWHPLTMLSLALDKQSWGESAYGFHLVNIILHCGTVYVSFVLFYQLLTLTRLFDSYKSSITLLISVCSVSSLLFGLHPLRVESVVWASERKDVLCVLFYVSACYFYVEYSKRQLLDSTQKFYQVKEYWISFSLICLSLMSKPTAVSFPFVLLLLDFYPLRVISGFHGLNSILVNKIPFIVVSFCVSLITLFAQTPAIITAPHIHLFSRLLVASKALIFYLYKMVWPINLAPYYPHPGNVANSELFSYLMYVFLVASLFALVFLTYLKQQRAWVVLCLFYIFTLIPMLGIIQVGGQWIADRYTYIPSLGVSLFWGAGCVLFSAKRWSTGSRLIPIMICFTLLAQIVAYALFTRQQIDVWRTNETLATREITLFPHKIGAAYYSRAKYRKEHGDCENALADVNEALSIALRGNIKSKYADISFSRAEVLLCLNRISDAMMALDWAIDTSSGEIKSEYIEFKRRLEGQVAEPSAINKI